MRSLVRLQHSVRKAVILAGGRGERLHSLTFDCPKPMLKIAGKPILEHQIDVMRRHGIKEVIILSGYMGNVIEDYFGNGSEHGIDIRHYLENKPMGTSGCLKALENEIDEDFLLAYGDVMFDLDLDDLFEYHKEKCAAATLVVHPNDHPYDSDIVLTDVKSEIVGFLPKSVDRECYPNQINAAMYVLSPRIFKYISKGVASDFVKDVFPRMLNFEKLCGYKTTEYIKDVGTVDRLEKVKSDFANGKIKRLSKKNKRPAIFLDRDGTLVKEVDLLHRSEDLELLPFSTPAIKRINESGYLSIVVTNQPVVARNLCSLETLKSIHDKFETLLGKNGVYVDEIYFCPHHPDKGYPEENPLFKIVCDCRKPKTGMIMKAASQYNIDLVSSWMIGDSVIDIQAAINAGLRSILLRKNNDDKNQNTSINPDFICDNLEEAVNVILNSRMAI
ncbi:MAG: HAD-IIIA family hydrolase [Pseudomonadota bacterium]